MSEFRVEVGRVSNIQKHPNADSLSTCEVFGYPLIIRTGDYAERDLAVYVPVDAVVPDDDPRWSFLAGHRRIKAKRLRGIYSQGVLTKPDPGWIEGQNVCELLRITKHDPGAGMDLGLNTENEPAPHGAPIYTDIEGFRRHPDVLHNGEEIVVTEKIHGANARYVVIDGRLRVGSHTRWKREDPRNMWWMVAGKYDFATKLAHAPGLVVFGEVYGQVQDLKYGAGLGDLFFRAFDVFDTSAMRYLDWAAFVSLTDHLGIDRVPVLYEGAWNPGDVLPMRNGSSMVPGAKNLREGFVVKPVVERWERSVGRVILKFVGEDYLLRKTA